MAFGVSMARASHVTGRVTDGWTAQVESLTRTRIRNWLVPRDRHSIVFKASLETFSNFPE